RGVCETSCKLNRGPLRAVQLHSFFPLCTAFGRSFTWLRFLGLAGRFFAGRRSCSLRLAMIDFASDRVGTRHERRNGFPTVEIFFELAHALEDSARKRASHRGRLLEFLIQLIAQLI